MKCPQCGTEAEPGGNFCGTCGERLPQSVAIMARPVSRPVSVVAMNPSSSSKSKVAAGLLQIFLGAFGAGRFYTGHIGLAFAQIAVTWLTCGLGVLWPIIDGILMLAGKVNDSDGRPLRD